MSIIDAADRAVEDTGSHAQAVENAEMFGEGFVKIQHRLLDSGLFTDEALARLIDRYPREYYHINNMYGEGEDRVWRDGDKGECSGEQVIAAVGAGTVWMNLRRFDIVAPEYHELIENAFADLAAKNPTLKTFKRESSLLVSSPDAKVYTHSDLGMICLWHLRGKKRVWVYPNDEKHVPPRVLEGIVLKETEEDSIPYTPEWDERGTPVDLEPGQAVSWPLNAPHRVNNTEGINVSVTTEFWTAEAFRKFGVYFTNGIIRRRFGFAPQSTKLYGPGALVKAGVGMLGKKLGVAKKEQHKYICEFLLDKDNPGKLIEIPKQDQWELSV